jgi:gluconate 2-dehydrogenase gamma chain
MSDGITRRQLLRDGSLYAGGLWLALSASRITAIAEAAAASGEPVVLTREEWKTVEAITGRIIPTDEQPGAIEARCVNFIDKALAGEEAAARALYAGGVGGVDAVARHRFDKAFIALAAARQDEVLAALEVGSPDGWPAGAPPAPVFFQTVRAHTIIGFLADPKYGGNAGYAGWKVTGYPGSRHHVGGYTPEEMTGARKIRTVWGEEV